MDLPRCRGNEIGAAHDVGDALLGIVHGTGQVVGEHMLGTVNDEIADVVLQSLAHMPLQAVVEFDLRAIGAYPQCASLASGCQPLRQVPG